MANTICPVTQKVGFTNAHAADRRIGMLGRFYDSEIEQVPRSAYRCEHCGKWHLSSYTPARSKRVQEIKRRQGAYNRRDKSWAREVEV